MKNNSLREKLLVGIVIVVLVSFLGYNFGYLKLVDYKDQLEDEAALLSVNDTNIEKLREEESGLKGKLNSLNSSIDEIKNSKGGTTINTQDFFLFLSTKSKELDIDIVKFKDEGTVEEDGVWRATFDVELNGYLTDMLKLSESIDDIDIAYDVKSMSLRQDKDEDYLVRLHKTQNSLQWFNVKEDEKEEVKDVKEDNIITSEDPVYVENEEEIKIPVEKGPVEKGPVEIPVDKGEGVSEDDLDTVERSAETIQEQLEMLLGITPSKETRKEKTVKPTRSGMIISKKIDKPKVEMEIVPKTPIIMTDKKFNNTRINMDFKIVFTMYSDPSTNYMNKDLYVSETSGGVKEFTVNKEGTTQDTHEINEKIKNNAEYLTEEIERVMVEITNMNEADEDSTLIKEYLNYLLSKR